MDIRLGDHVCLVGLYAVPFSWYKKDMARKSTQHIFQNRCRNTSSESIAMMHTYLTSMPLLLLWCHLIFFLHASMFNCKQNCEDITVSRTKGVFLYFCTDNLMIYWSWNDACVEMSSLIVITCDLQTVSLTVYWQEFQANKMIVRTQS